MIVTTSEETAALRIQRGSFSVTIYPNGCVELTPGVTLDHAAKLFWDAVAKNFPHEAAVKAERERCVKIVQRRLEESDSWGSQLCCELILEELQEPSSEDA